ncbi:MAG TPA: glycosyltransferase family 1 protein [Solirubrobacteraceae bacterium]|jgi:alpha-1,3-rhamnosyl/mannosyltransferase|nr:glycosyltransferase family 1 protein [Solirubrobacteraceae bacterium]
MRVAFDSRAVSDPQGVGRYSRCLLSALDETAAAGDELVQTDRPSALARSRGADVFHAPWIAGAMLHSPCPMVVTIHELAALKRRSEHLRTGLRWRLRHLAVQRAARVIVPTRTVAEDALAHLRLRPEQVVVIPEAADPVMYPRGAADIAAVRERFRLPERFLVWVGGLRQPNPAKHVGKLAAAARELPLVLVGATRPWTQELPGVILTDRVSDEQLASIYSAAHALVVSSTEEGFGLPAVEALACGTPVVACESPALREVLGERATFVAPGDMQALVSRAQEAARPAPEPPRWSWEDAARATWEVYAGAGAC